MYYELTWTDYDLRVEDLSLRNALILPPEVVVAALARRTVDILKFFRSLVTRLYVSELVLLCEGGMWSLLWLECQLGEVEISRLLHGR